MKNYILALVLSAGVFLPLAASAHQQNTYTINGHIYTFTVGSTGEPVVVDDKTGIDLAIMRDSVPYIGAEATLKLETISGTSKTTSDLKTVWGLDGRYSTTIYYTTPDPISYRLFGALEGTPIDLLFSCMPSGHKMHAEEVKKDVPISEGVLQTATKGSFGCPAPKAGYEFPRASGAQAAILRRANLALGLAAAALALAAVTFALQVRRRRSGN